MPTLTRATRQTRQKRLSHWSLVAAAARVSMLQGILEKVCLYKERRGKQHCRTLTWGGARRQELPCGHFMHSHCFAQYARYNYTCPVCAKSMGDMSVYFRMLDSLLARDAAELPPAYAARCQARPATLAAQCGGKGI